VSLDLIVVRDLGDRDGGEVFDPLLTTVAVALGKGAQLINSYTPVNVVTLKTVFRSGVRKGQLCEVMDAMQGITWRGIIMGVNHVIEGPSTYTQLEIERQA